MIKFNQTSRSLSPSIKFKGRPAIRSNQKHPEVSEDIFNNSLLKAHQVMKKLKMFEKTFKTDLILRKNQIVRVVRAPTNYQLDNKTFHFVFKKVDARILMKRRSISPFAPTPVQKKQTEHLTDNNGPALSPVKLKIQNHGNLFLSYVKDLELFTKLKH